MEEISKSYYGNLYRAATALKFDQILALEDKNSNADVGEILRKQLVDSNSITSRAISLYFVERVEL